MRIEPQPMRIVHGRLASPGLVSGRLVPLPAPCRLQREPGSVETELTALRQALHKAIEDLNDLIGGSSGQAAEILGLQVAMLEDAALSEAAFELIATGMAAEQAWTTALEAEMADYLASADEYFRARAGDLFDMKERVLDALGGGYTASINPGSIILADDLAPSRFLASGWQGCGIVLRNGSPTSHVAMLARSNNIPMIVAIGGLDADALAHTPALLHAEHGTLALHPSPEASSRFAAAQGKAAAIATFAANHIEAPGKSADGQVVAVLLNVADASELARIDPAICDGIGLVRTELLFAGRALPGEEEQYQAYRAIAEWAQGRPVTLRTLDAGADKPIEGITPRGESNPFLGVRGVRLTLRHPELFKTQLRAMSRAAMHGDVRIMLPMVSLPAELAACRALLAAAVGELIEHGAAHRTPPLGMMVEVPAAAISIAEFAADFYSIGSNDLTQYVMAAGRDIADVADLADCANPAVLALVRRVVQHGLASGKPVSLCGDAAGDARVLPMLLATGLRSLSVAPTAVGPTKACLAGLILGAV